jgi:hypothetical protein
MESLFYNFVLLDNKHIFNNHMSNKAYFQGTKEAVISAMSQQNLTVQIMYYSQKFHYPIYPVIGSNIPK